MSAQPKLRCALEEYLRLDRVSHKRLEFRDGFRLRRELDSTHDVIKLSLLDCEPPLQKIYRGVEFDDGKIKITIRRDKCIPGKLPH